MMRLRFTQVRRVLFPSPFQGVLNVMILAGAGLLFAKALEWLVLGAVPATFPPDACRTAEGACWPFMAEHLGSFIFGFYPEEMRWRPVLAMLLGVAVLGSFVTGWARRNRPLKWFLVLASPILCWLLLLGGPLGLDPVNTDRLGGMILTLLVAGFAIATGLPLGFLLALMRSSSMPAFRWTAVAWIEVWRGLPTVVVLFMFITIFPFVVEKGVEVDKLLRALLAFTMLTSALFAEAIRGGLQAVGDGQKEAALALGLGRWQTLRKVVLPQAIQYALPNVINICISLIKESTLVLIVGLYDLFGIIQLATIRPEWASESVMLTGYMSAGVAFWAICFVLSRWSLVLERIISPKST